MGGNYAAAPRNAAASPPPRKYRPFKKGKRGLRELCVPSHRWRINLYAASGNQAKEPTPKARTCLETDLREGLKLQSLSLSLSLALSLSRLCFILTPFRVRDAFKRATLPPSVSRRTAERHQRGWP